MDKFLALAEPTRRNIIELLAQNKRMRASTIYAHFPVSHPAISQHLKVLRETKLVKVEKIAQLRIYTINTNALLEIQEWMLKLSKLWNARFDRIDKLLEEEKKKLQK